MKVKFFVALSCAVLICSCSTDRSMENESVPDLDPIQTDPDPDPQTPKKSVASFSFSISVKSAEGAELLTVDDGDTLKGYFSENNISLKSVDESLTASFSISSQSDGSQLMDVVVSGEMLDGVSSYSMSVVWGRETETSLPDSIKCEVEKSGDAAYCTKIFINGELKWEGNQTGSPLCSVVRERDEPETPDIDPVDLSSEEKGVLDNAFAFKLFKSTYKEALLENGVNTNVLISPLSVNYAFAMLLNGAEGETRKELMDVLYANAVSVEQINEYNKALTESLLSVDPSVEIDIANSIWSDITFDIKDEFIRLNKTFYDAEVRTIDFKSSDEALTTVNAWCAEKTRNKIPNALIYLPETTKTLLINTLYFKSAWSEYFVFNKDFTFLRDFHSADGSVEKVAMMHRTFSYPYAEDNYSRYLKIPFGSNNESFESFGNEAYNMTFIQPVEGKSMQDVIDNIDKFEWTKSGNMSNKHISLQLPKFKVEESYKMERSILPQIGMILPLSIWANYSKISDFPIVVDGVIHKTYLEIDESGAEAAAVSIIVGVVGSSSPIYAEFHLDHPFIFAICENNTGTILFLGLVNSIN